MGRKVLRIIQCDRVGCGTEATNAEADGWLNVQTLYADTTVAKAEAEAVELPVFSGDYCSPRCVQLAAEEEQSKRALEVMRGNGTEPVSAGLYL